MGIILGVGGVNPSDSDSLSEVSWGEGASDSASLIWELLSTSVSSWVGSGVSLVATAGTASDVCGVNEE